MTIHVVSPGYKQYEPGDFLLEHVTWNDWWTYENLYMLYYMNGDNVPRKVGYVKIGQVADRNEKIPNLPLCFNALDNSRFVSLGQDTSYYERLNLLSRETRINILTSLNDIAYNIEYLEQYRTSEVIRKSLLRDYSISTVRNQLHRVAHGGAMLTSYEFSFDFKRKDSVIESSPMTFSVVPESNPPTNIHVLIGRNGVGKTWLLSRMINSLYNGEENGGFDFVDVQSRFANVVCVAFSVFDQFPREFDEEKLKYTFIGVKTRSEGKEIDLNEQFAMSLTACMSNSNRYNRWKETISVLNSDPIFADINLIEKAEYIQNNRKDYTRERAKIELSSIFGKLSSGHKIVALTITRLVETVEECTLVLLDEPELHLHPPLLAAFTRALSQLLINRNGVAIIATHSPVILQEVPQSCVWILRRSGRLTEHYRPEKETFGENVGRLTTEVFGLEVMDSGFHKMLRDVLEKNNGDFFKAVKDLDNQLGSEALAILKVLSIHYGG